jgi:hypothetical protein
VKRTARRYTLSSFSGERSPPISKKPASRFVPAHAATNHGDKAGDGGQHRRGPLREDRVVAQLDRELLRLQNETIDPLLAT